MPSIASAPSRSRNKAAAAPPLPDPQPQDDRGEEEMAETLDAAAAPPPVPAPAAPALEPAIVPESWLARDVPIWRRMEMVADDGRAESPAREAFWRTHVWYLYRQSPEIVKADPNERKYIARGNYSIDEEWVKKSYGGGRYLLYLKNRKTQDMLNQEGFSIDGDPKLQADERLIPRPSAAPAAVAAAPLGAPASAELAELRAKIDELQARPGADKSALDQLNAMYELIQKMNPAPAAPVAGGELNTLLMGLLSKLLNSSMDNMFKGKSLVEELKSMGEIMSQLGWAPPGKQNGGGREDWRAVLAREIPGALDKLTQIAQTWSATEQAKYQAMRLAAERRRQSAAPPAAELPPAPPNLSSHGFVGQQTEGASGSSSVTQPAANAGARRLEIVPVGAPPIAITAPAPAPESPAVTEAVPAAPVALAAPAEGAAVRIPVYLEGRFEDGSIDLEYVSRKIVRYYKNEDTGYAVAVSLKDQYPDFYAMFREIFQDPKQAKTIALADPVLSEIANDPTLVEDDAGEAVKKFDHFLEEFCEEMRFPPPGAGAAVSAELPA